MKGNISSLQVEKAFWSQLGVLSFAASVSLNLLISSASKAVIMTEDALKADHGRIERVWRESVCADCTD